MKPGTDPITDDEFLLRLVWHERFTTRVPVISSSTFEPRAKGQNPDADGLSLFREACLSAPTDALAVIPADKRARYGIVRIPYTRLAELGLTGATAPRDDAPGHVVVPEMNGAAFADKAHKAIFVRWQLRLAGIASENIAPPPFTE